mmetsp:Transcript_8304/g.6199  ORF Transcript_8304/g.6199 Transcript_8304/m.6199 type:complete len:80 (-) Transcript_8304:362-601(-)
MTKLKGEGVNFNCFDYRGRSPLHVAVATGNLEIVQFLVHQGVNINIYDKSGSTPLFHAVKRSYRAIAEFLNSKGGFLQA